jgi:hypothetical protein
MSSAGIVMCVTIFIGLLALVMCFAISRKIIFLRQKLVSAYNSVVVGMGGYAHAVNLIIPWITETELSGEVAQFNRALKEEIAKCRSDGNTYVSGLLLRKASLENVLEIAIVGTDELKRERLLAINSFHKQKKIVENAFAEFEKADSDLFSFKERVIPFLKKGQ